MHYFNFLFRWGWWEASIGTSSSASLHTCPYENVQHTCAIPTTYSCSYPGTLLYPNHQEVGWQHSEACQGIPSGCQAHYVYSRAYLLCAFISVTLLVWLQEIQERIPADPFEAELLMMAEAVATETKSDTETSDDEENTSML